MFARVASRLRKLTSETLNRERCLRPGAKISEVLVGTSLPLTLITFGMVLTIPLIRVVTPRKALQLPLNTPILMGRVASTKLFKRLVTCRLKLTATNGMVRNTLWCKLSTILGASAPWLAPSRTRQLLKPSGCAPKDTLSVAWCEQALILGRVTTTCLTRW